MLDKKVRGIAEIETCSDVQKERPSGPRRQNLTGMVFGELTVVSCLGSQGKSGGVRWRCQCSCGNMYETYGTLLVNGRRCRCSGSAHKKNYVSADIRNHRFDRLTAIEPTGKRTAKGSVIWRCICDCGREIEASYNELKYTNLKSCGCKKKEHDIKLKDYLVHIDGTSVDMLKSKKIPTDNTTGYRGVYLIRGKYTAKIVFQKKAYYLGSFEAIEDAAEARRKAEELLFEGFTDFYERWKQKAEEDPAWAKKTPISVTVEKNEKGELEVRFMPDLSL